MPQENNMAEIVRLLDTAIGKIDGLATDVRNLDVRLERVEGKVDRLEVKVDGLEVKVATLDLKVTRLGGKVDSIADTVMKNDRRLERGRTPH